MGPYPFCKPRKPPQPYPLRRRIRNLMLLRPAWSDIFAPMDTYTAIHNRRSVRPGEYDDRPLEREVLERLIAAANAAPTHKRTYPWRFVVFASASAKTHLGDYLAQVEAAAAPVDTPVPDVKLRKTRERPHAAAAAIAIVMRPDLEKLPEWEEISATASAVQNLWLAATAEGLVGYWSSPGAMTRGAEDFLKLADGERCLGLFYLGYPKLDPAPITRPSVEAKVEWR